MEDLDLRSDLWDSSAGQSTPAEIETLAAALVQAVEPLSGKDKWKLSAVYAGRYGDVHRQPWTNSPASCGWFIAKLQIPRNRS